MAELATLATVFVFLIQVVAYIQNRHTIRTNTNGSRVEAVNELVAALLRQRERLGTENRHLARFDIDRELAKLRDELRKMGSLPPE